MTVSAQDSIEKELFSGALGFTKENRKPIDGYTAYKPEMHQNLMQYKIDDKLPATIDEEYSFNMKKIEKFWKVSSTVSIHTHFRSSKKCMKCQKRFGRNSKCNRWEVAVMIEKVPFNNEIVVNSIKIRVIVS